MKGINSKDLFDYINELEYGKEVKFKVYKGKQYITDVKWNGMDFCWESGKFSSGAFFDYDYWFEPIEDKIEQIEMKYYQDEPANICDLAHKVYEIIDKLNTIEW